LTGNGGHRSRLDVTIERAAEHTGDVTADPDAIGFGAGEHWFEALDGFGNRAIDIGPRETFGRRSEHRHDLGAGRDRGVIALLIWHQNMKFADGQTADGA